MCFWIKQNLVRPNHESKRGCAVLVEHIYVIVLSLYILEKIVLVLVLKRVVDLKLDDRLFHIFGPK